MARLRAWGVGGRDACVQYHESKVAMPDALALPPDPVIEAYKKDVDRTLIREMLKLTPEQRILKLQDFVAFAVELREAGRRPQR